MNIVYLSVLDLISSRDEYCISLCVAQRKCEVLSPSSQILQEYRVPGSRMGVMMKDMDFYVTPVLNVDGYIYSWISNNVSTAQTHCQRWQLSQTILFQTIILVVICWSFLKLFFSYFCHYFSDFFQIFFSDLFDFFSDFLFILFQVFF